MLMVTSGTWKSSGRVVLKMTWTSADIVVFPYIYSQLILYYLIINRFTISKSCILTETTHLASFLSSFYVPPARPSSDRSSPSVSISYRMHGDYSGGMLPCHAHVIFHRRASRDHGIYPWLRLPREEIS